MNPSLGIYGGSFDPVHNGHIALAEALRDRFLFQEIRFLPAARNPLKGDASDNQHRLAMLELALKDKQALTIDTRELYRPPPSYTIDTLREIRQEVGSKMPLVFIMGYDSFIELPRWKDWQQLTDVAHLLVVNRPGTPPTLPAELTQSLQGKLHKAAAQLDNTPSGKVWLVDTPPHAVASRDIRAAVREGKSLDGWLNPAVAEYIGQHRLYGKNIPMDENRPFSG